MDATIAGVDSLQGDIDTATGKVESTAPATNYFIQVQSDLGSAADIIKVPKKRRIKKMKTNYLDFIAACAAWDLAIGTRGLEQET